MKWSIELDRAVSLAEVCALAIEFDCKCAMASDGSIVLRPFHPETPCPSATDIARVIERGADPGTQRFVMAEILSVRRDAAYAPS